MKFIHLTDPHCLPVGVPLYGSMPRQRLDEAVLSINKAHADAACLFITGDLVEDARVASYLELRQVLSGLHMPYHLLLGNHDRRSPFLAVFPETPQTEDGFVQYAVETSAGIMICLDTLDESHAAGVLCKRRLGWLRAELSRHADKPVFIFMHHPPLRLGIPGMDAMSLRNPADFWDCVTAHRTVRHVFFGHVHRTISGVFCGVPFANQRGTNHQVALEQADPLEVTGTLEPPAYSVVLCDLEQVTVHTSGFGDHSPRFSLADRAARRAASPQAISTTHRTEPNQ